MNAPVDAPTPTHTRIRSVDNGVDILIRHAAADDFDNGVVDFHNLTFSGLQRDHHRVTLFAILCSTSSIGRPIAERLAHGAQSMTLPSCAVIANVPVGVLTHQ